MLGVAFSFVFQYNNFIMAELIQPRVLKGFRDILPQAEIVRTNLMEKITGVYRSFGFVEAEKLPEGWDEIPAVLEL